MQKFYKEIVSKDSNNFTMLTISCKDQQDKVNAYIKENKYSFPVAMANGTIEATYNVYSYPTKLLITPQGKYIIIPFGIDWVNFIKRYANL